MTNENMHAIAISVDVGTDTTTMMVCDDNDLTDVVSVATPGATTWHGGAAFDIKFIPHVLLQLLIMLDHKGWSFKTPGCIVFSIRQHDLVLLDANDKVQIPALSWQCNAAQFITNLLNGNHQVKTAVGIIEPRYILPKAAWAFSTDTALHDANSWIMTTGDWIVYMLTGARHLSTSDALSNGLLEQRSRKISYVALKAVWLSSELFPPVIKSDPTVGQVKITDNESDPWHLVQLILNKWSVGASLGDNHAGAASALSGQNESDFETIISSFGTSGTNVRICSQDATLVGNAAKFEFFDHRLLLKIIHRCASLYNDVCRNITSDSSPSHAQLDQAALNVQPNEIESIPLLNFIDCHGIPDHRSSWWERNISVGHRVAAAQLSLVHGMLVHLAELRSEVKSSPTSITQCVAVGGLTKSQLIREAYAIGIGCIGNKMQVKVGPSSATGAAAGALVTALGHFYGGARQKALERLTTLETMEQPTGPRADAIQKWFKINPVTS